MTYDITTATGKVNTLLTSDYNKVSLSEEIGMSRPTLDTRLKKENWKKPEIEMINKIFKKVNGNT